MRNGFKCLIVPIAHYIADNATKLFEILFRSMSLNIAKKAIQISALLLAKAKEHFVGFLPSHPSPLQ